MKSNKGTGNITKFLNAVISLLLFCVLIFSVWILIKRLMDKNNLDSEIKEINDAVCSEHEGQNEHECVNLDEPKTDYFNYLKISCDDVDITKLKNINEDTVGFLSVSGTNINYPVVQAKDNKFYLKRSFKKADNSSGWLFMDYRNNSESFGKNTVIYGHSNLDKSMFGSLSDILNEQWRKNSGNGKIKFVNLSGTSDWKIISAYTIPAESYYIKTDFNSGESFGSWLREISERSFYDFGYEVSENDKIMTFSTCYKNEGNVRLVVHAKKI